MVWMGIRIFALSAEGYETLEFCDDMSGQSEDLGLLSWMTGAVSIHDRGVQVSGTC